MDLSPCLVTEVGEWVVMTAEGPPLPKPGQALITLVTAGAGIGRGNSRG